MNFYFFGKENGLGYLVLIYANWSNEARKKYNDVVCCNEGKSEFIDNGLALELICSSNLEDDEFNDVISEIKKAQNTKKLRWYY